MPAFVVVALSWLVVAAGVVFAVVVDRFLPSPAFGPSFRWGLQNLLVWLAPPRLEVVEGHHLLR